MTEQCDQCIMMEGRYIESTDNLFGWNMSDEKVVMPFRCDLEKGHKGHHVSNSDPPKKIGVISWHSENPNNKDGE